MHCKTIGLLTKLICKNNTRYQGKSSVSEDRSVPISLLYFNNTPHSFGYEQFREAVSSLIVFQETLPSNASGLLSQMNNI